MILILSVATFFTSVLTVFLTLLVSKKYSLYDVSNERKIHKGFIPRLGGVGIFLSFIISFVIYIYAYTNADISQIHIPFLFIALFFIFIMGLLDDIKPWRARYKMFAQIIATIFILLVGYRFNEFTLASFSIHFDLGFFGYMLAFFWIMGVTNALNLIDGIDGLAGTISLIVSLSYGFIFYLQGNNLGFTISIFLAISILGFLVFNLPFPKAKIFMGDSGSQFLGFMLAIIPFLKNPDGNSGGIPLYYAFALLTIPIFDTFAAFWRRWREHTKFSVPDKFHLHHKIMLLGFSSRKTLIMLGILQLILSVLVIVASKSSDLISIIILFTVSLIGIFFFSIVHFKKEDILKKQSLRDKKVK